MLIYNQMFKKSVQQQLLSYHYSGKQIKNNKLNLFGKAIVVVDSLPINQSLSSSILEVDLSHNAIYEIETMEQLTHTEFVNLSHNRITDGQQLLKLRQLPQLHSLYLKGNPFLRTKMKPALVSFLLSLHTDVEVVSAEISGCLQSYVLKAIQNDYFRHYLGKIEVHLQLANNYQLDDSFLNPSLAIFPKIKKLFEQLAKEQTLRRHLVQRIPQEYFEDERLLLGFVKQAVERAEAERSQLVKKIYEREELLRNVRSTYKHRVVPKRTVMRNMGSSGGIGINHFSPPRGNQLSPPRHKESVNQTKGSKISRKIYEKENSPSRLSSELGADNEQAFLSALIKLNPLYHLLHSPLPSLKPNEKELLIQNLCAHLREKFKEVLKYEKKEQQYLRAKEESSSLQEHLREVSSEMKEEHQKVSNKLKKLSLICQEESQRVQSLCQELAQTRQELSQLKAANAQLSKQNEEYKYAVSLGAKQERAEEQLRERIRNNLKRRVLGVLNYKAYHLSQLAMLQEINRKVGQKDLKENALQNLISNAQLSKAQRILKKHLMAKHLQTLFRNGGEVHKCNQLQYQAIEAISTLRKRWNVQYIQKIGQKQKQGRQKVDKLRRKMARRVKLGIFEVMKEQMQEKQQEQEWVELHHHSQVIALRKHFRTWGRFVREIEIKTGQCAVQLHIQQKTTALSTFIERCRQELNYKSAILATDSFLLKIRRINGYLKISKSVGSVLSGRRLKQRKIELIRQHQYFYWFISNIRDWQVRKRMLVEREIELRKRKEEESKRQQQTTKISKMASFILFIKQARSSIVKLILEREKKWMEVSDQKESACLRAFINNLRSHWISRFKLAAKSQLVRSALFRRRALLFVGCLKSKSLQLQKVRATIKRDRLVKCFFRWKCFGLWHKMQSYKHKFEELQPEISHISHMQREVEKQKELLLLQIEQKQMMVSDYEKRCEEYEYMLHSKDLKYDKLREIYSEAMQQQQMNSTAKVQEDMSRYLGALKVRLGMKNKVEDQESYLKSLTNNFKPELGRDTLQRVNAIKSRDSFISSFKRF